MRLYDAELGEDPMANNRYMYVCDDSQGAYCPTDPSSFYTTEEKPVEIYLFIDPLCPECWVIDPIIKKLQMEYGHYLRLKTFIGISPDKSSFQSGRNLQNRVQDMANSYHETACRTGIPCEGDVWYENPLTTPYTAAMAIKAAEMQGKSIGSKYSRRIREALFLKKKNIADKNVLIDCARHIDGMDIEAFEADLASDEPKKALESDMQTTNDMNIDTVPSMVILGEDPNEPGIKIKGNYSYSIYVDILEDLLGKPLEKCPLISIEQFVSFYSVVAEKELAIIYDLSIEDVRHELKKLQLRCLVDETKTKHGSVWRTLAPCY